MSDRLADRQPWKVDAPGERARRYATIENAAPWIAALASEHQPAPVSVQEVGGWSLFYVRIDSDGAAIITGAYTWVQALAVQEAMEAREDA